MAADGREACQNNYSALQEWPSLVHWDDAIAKASLCQGVPSVFFAACQVPFGRCGFTSDPWPWPSSRPGVAVVLPHLQVVVMAWLRALRLDLRLRRRHVSRPRWRQSRSPVTSASVGSPFDSPASR